MDFSTIEMLKKDLKKAIREKNFVRVEELKQLLNISDEQAKYFDRGLTGYPSVDQVWLKKYDDSAYEKVFSYSKNKTVWDVLEEKLLEYYDIPAIEYFKKQISREEFREDVYTWARTFRAMGVESGEIVPIYGPFFPDIGAMCLALNMIGATSYFLKLAISPEALEEETREAKVAVVFDGMWPNVAHEFSKDKFKKVIVATVTNSMPSPKKEIVSFLSHIKAKKNKSTIPDDKKYVWVDEAKKIADYYTGEVKTPFVPNRNAFITSSSGTTIGGVVKGVVATNESTIAQMQMSDVSDIAYFPGDRCLNNFPPTASTSLNCLFFQPLFSGLTIVSDPRVSEKDFYNQIMDLKPNNVLSTGSMWETFFTRVYNEMKAGKKFDFSFANKWSVGGEGIDTKKFIKWNEILRECGGRNPLYSGYGLSEFFAVVTADTNYYKSNENNSKPVIGVGYPFCGITVGIFDEKGKEVPYNTRGELWAKSESNMKEYYNKPELTKQILINGWIHTGDLAEMDENGAVFVWGRMNDRIQLDDDKSLYLFDIANKIKENPSISDAMVLQMNTSASDYSVVAHIVWDEKVSNEEKEELLLDIDNQMKEYLPDGVKIIGYAEHSAMIPYSPTTLKKDKNRMSKQTKGYVQVKDGNVCAIKLEPNNGVYEIVCETLENRKKLILK